MVADGEGATALNVIMAETARRQKESEIDSEVKIDENGVFKFTAFSGLWRIANMFSRTKLIPVRFQYSPGNPNAASDCAVAILMAQRLGVNEVMFLQNCYVVKGTPAIEAKLAVTRLHKSGLLSKGCRVDYEKTLDKNGKVLTCRAVVEVGENNDEIVGAEINWQMINGEGWSTKDGSKWKTMPELMFEYRSAMFLIRSRFPEVILGMQSKEELDDTFGAGAADGRLSGGGYRTITAGATPEDLEKIMGETAPDPPKKRPRKKPSGKGKKKGPPPIPTKDENKVDLEKMEEDDNQPGPLDVMGTTQLTAMCGTLEVDPEVWDIAGIVENVNGFRRKESEDVIRAIRDKRHPEWETYIRQDPVIPTNTRQGDTQAEFEEEHQDGQGELFEGDPEAATAAEIANVEKSESGGDPAVGPPANLPKHMMAAWSSITQYKQPFRVARLWHADICKNDRFSDGECELVYKWADDRIQNLTKGVKSLDDWSESDFVDT